VFIQSVSGWKPVFFPYVFVTSGKSGRRRITAALKLRAHYLRMYVLTSMAGIASELMKERVLEV
jgi:hypothetical protein